MHVAGSGQQSSPLLVAVSSVLRLGTWFRRCARCSWLRWHHAPLHRWASSIPQAVAHSVQAAVLGSMIAPSNLRGHSLPNNSFKPTLLRNSANSSVRCHMEARASICALTDNAGEVEQAESWLERNRARLSHVSEMNGCGCCVFSWDVQGPKEVIDTLPLHLSAGSAWASSDPQ